MSKVNTKSKPVTSEKDKKPDNSKETAKKGNENKNKLDTENENHAKVDEKTSHLDKTHKNESKPSTPNERSFDNILDRSLSSKGTRSRLLSHENKLRKKGHSPSKEKKKTKEKKKEKKILPLDQQSIFI